MKLKLRGVFLTSGQAEATARFYRDVAGLALETIGTPGEYVYWKVEQGGLQIAIHDAAKFAEYTHPAKADSNLTHLYFQIESQDAFLEHLKALEIVPFATDDVVITVTDPDGRKVMFGIA